DQQGDPIESLARRYLSRPGTPRMDDWETQIDRTITLAREYKIDGIVHLPQVFDYPRQFADPYFRKRLEEKSIPAFTVARDHIPAQMGPLVTRVGAFIEMIESGYENGGNGGRS
ncbi:MAG: 2-hydroxyacyl-CoA dehydratase family protein, partial [Dehalococcoidia bacterium]|nr:2-hydroxyacyl-CoA dehydratase family protein [Dehalococcoidia bacterium]